MSGVAKATVARGQSAPTPAPALLTRSPASAPVGNQASLRRLSATPRRMQPKLEIGAVNDPLEHEAGAVAEQVMRMPDPRLGLSASQLRISRKCAECEKEDKLQMKRASTDRAGEAVPPVVDEVLRSPGQPLDGGLRGFFEPRFREGFANVRVHDDDRAARSAHQLGARAYAAGTHIAFASGAYAPYSATGRRLIAHELAHVAQQNLAGADQGAVASVRREMAPDPSAAPAVDSGGPAATPLPTAPSGSDPAAPSAEPMNAPGGARKRGGPTSAAFWSAYSQVGYNVWAGEEHRHDVWKFIGGSVGKGFDGQNTCAARVSYGLNYGGAPIAGFDNISTYHNDPNTVFEGKAGDDKNYNVSAPGMATHLAKIIGPRDTHLSTGDQGLAFEQTLAADQCAMFAGPHHSGLIKGSGYKDPYVMTDPGVMPVDVWKLS